LTRFGHFNHKTQNSCQLSTEHCNLVKSKIFFFLNFITLAFRTLTLYTISHFSRNWVIIFHMHIYTQSKQSSHLESTSNFSFSVLEWYVYLQGKRESLRRRQKYVCVVIFRLKKINVFPGIKNMCHWINALRIVQRSSFVDEKYVSLN